MKINDYVNFLLPGEFIRKSGSEWAGPCPMCGGKDRFIVILDQRRAGGIRWFCRNCRPPKPGKAFDAIDLLKSWKGMNYADSCAYLGIAKRGRQKTPEDRRNMASRSTLSSARKQEWRPPNAQWRSMAQRFLIYCQQDFALDWGSANSKLLRSAAYSAIQSRYLTLRGCLQTGIGYNHRNFLLDRTLFGLNPQENLTKLSIPQGIVIFIRRKCGIVGMTVRLNVKTGPKYKDIAKDGSIYPYIAGEPGQPVIICESALDAALAFERSREIGQPMAVIGLQGANKLNFDPEAMQLIKNAPELILNWDRDNKGKEAARALQQKFPRALCLAAYESKDLGDMERRYYEEQAAIDVNAWLAWALEKASDGLAVHLK